MACSAARSSAATGGTSEGPQARRSQALQVPGLMAQPSMCNLAAEDQRLTKGPKPWAVEPSPGPGARPWRQAAHQPKGAGGEPGGGGAADVGDPGVCHAGLRGVGPQ